MKNGHLGFLPWTVWGTVGPSYCPSGSNIASVAKPGSQPTSKHAAVLMQDYQVRHRALPMDIFASRALNGPDQNFLETRVGVWDSSYPMLLPSFSHFTGISPTLLHEDSLCLLLFSSLSIQGSAEVMPPWVCLVRW